MGLVPGALSRTPGARFPSLRQSSTENLSVQAYATSEWAISENSSWDSNCTEFYDGSYLNI